MKDVSELDINTSCLTCQIKVEVSKWDLFYPLPGNDVSEPKFCSPVKCVVHCRYIFLNSGIKSWNKSLLFLTTTHRISSFLRQFNHPLMALSFSSTTSIPYSKFRSNSTSQFDRLSIQIRCPSVVTIKCESKEPSAEAGLPAKSSKLEIGSPVIFIEAPKMMKTAASVPCLRVNSGLVKPGDVGRYSLFSSLQCMSVSNHVY